jgi:hypothetical protein
MQRGYTFMTIKASIKALTHTSILSDDHIQLFLNSSLRFRITGSGHNYVSDANRTLAVNQVSSIHVVVN